MATYTELYDLFSNSDLRLKIEVAAAIAAQTIIDGDDSAAPFSQDAGAHDLRLKWANAALSDTRGAGVQILKYVLAANVANSVAQITGASDVAIQGNVNAAIDGIAAAQFGA